jgi:hypothetical protein
MEKVKASSRGWAIARWSLRLLADKAVELHYIDSISYETIRRLLKKRNKTLEEARVGHSSQAQC